MNHPSNIVPELIAAAALVLAAVRIWRRSKRGADSPYPEHQDTRTRSAADDHESDIGHAMPSTPFDSLLSRETRLVAAREIRERVRGRLFRV